MLTEITAQGRVDAAGKLIGPNGNDMGVVAFTEGPYGTIIRLDVSGLAPGWHGIHLHKVGDCSDGADGFKASGGHVNPDGFAHGLLNPEGNHRADLVNIYAGTDGRVTAELYREGVNLLPSEAAAAENGPFPLLDEDGFAVIIHENEDDHMTQPIGGAGGRVACAALTE
ncbi:MAG: superoxide dismutase family protein [Pseudomonadota bacterium]